jgi:hypothetical protein
MQNRIADSRVARAAFHAGGATVPALRARTAPVGAGLHGRAARLTPLLLCLLLSGCSSGGEGMLILGAPGKYQYYNCEQLAAVRVSGVAREKELRELIERAERGPGGVVAGALAYRTDYVAVSEDLRVLEAEARSKNCATPPTWRSTTIIR